MKSVKERDNQVVGLLYRGLLANQAEVVNSGTLSL